jgi:cytochrome b561
MKSAASIAGDPAVDALNETRAYAIREYRMPAKVMHWITAGLVFLMFASGVIAKQLGDGVISDTLFSLHKLTGALTLVIVMLRILYRILRAMPEWQLAPHRRPILHWTLYGVAVLVPLLGWAGISDFGSREIFPGFSLPAIWPEGAGYDALLLEWHAYLAFGLLALVALHIGVAVHDYMTNEWSAHRPPE